MIMVLVVLMSCWLYLINYNNMSLENWGGMTKAQDNSQTIDEAIAAAIAEHEADPESHMGVGESIENHRINEIIDHPQGSVLVDKKQVSQMELVTCFESVTGWTFNAAYHLNEFGALLLETNTSNNNVASAWLEDGVPVLCEHLDKNVIFQAVFDFFGTAVGQFDLNGQLIKIWESTKDADRSGFGFKQTGVWKCCSGIRKQYKGFKWSYV